MDNALIIDLMLLAVLLLGAVLGWRRGLIRTVMGLTAVLLALLGASLLTNLLTEPVTDLVYPKVQEKVLSQFEQTLLPDGEEKQPQEPEQPDESDEPGLLDGVLEKLRRFGVNGEETVKAAGEAGMSVLDAAVRALVRTVVQAVLFLLCFLLLTLALTLVSHALGLLFRLPLLDGVNAIGGALLGFAEALLLVYLALWLAPRLGITFFADHAPQTHLLAFLMQNTPNTLWTKLIKA